MPATIDDVDAICRSLPEVEEGAPSGKRCWTVGGKAFAWVRPYSKADLKRFAVAGETPPSEPVLAVVTADLHDKEAVLAEDRKGVFTIEHFNGYPGLLVHLETVGKRTLRELVVDAWTAKAPSALVDERITKGAAPRATS